MFKILGHLRNIIITFLHTNLVPTQQWVENAQERWRDTPSPNRRHESSNKRRNNLGKIL